MQFAQHDLALTQPQRVGRQRVEAHGSQQQGQRTRHADQVPMRVSSAIVVAWCSRTGSTWAWATGSMPLMRSASLRRVSAGRGCAR